MINFKSLKEGNLYYSDKSLVLHKKTICNSSELAIEVRFIINPKEIFFILESKNSLYTDYDNKTVVATWFKILYKNMAYWMPFIESDDIIDFGLLNA